MDRRAFVTRAGGGAALAVGAWVFRGRPGLAWQEQATPVADLSSLGLPEVTISVDDTRIATSTAVKAGRVLMTVKNTGTKELHFVGIGLPDDVSNEQAMADLASPTPPAWFDFNHLPTLGNPDWPAPGTEARGVVDVVAGRWLVLDPIDGRMPAFWSVTAGDATPTVAVEPPADVEVGMLEMDFTGLDDPVPSGSKIWKIANAGTIAHEFVIVKVAADMTKETMVAMVTAADRGGDISWFVPAGEQGITGGGGAS